MRLVYLDEAGISNVAQEPILVVAGVIVDADNSWKELESYFTNLAENVRSRYEEDDDLSRFVFHAKDIFHGSGFFDRKNWTNGERRKVLRQLAQLPKLFDLPIVAGVMDRELVKADILQSSPNAPAKTIRTMVHARAFLTAVLCVEFWMENNAPNEVAMLISEDNDQFKKAIESFHEGYTDPTIDVEGAFKSKFIVDAVHFAKKPKSPLLQIADFCAFIIKRKAMERGDIDEFYELIEPQLRTDFGHAGGFALRLSVDQVTPVESD